MGSIYKRGRRYWIQYFDGHGKKTNVSIGFNHDDAKRELRFREGQIAEGKHPAPHAERVTFNEIAELVINDYVNNNYRSIYDLKNRVENLKAHFDKIPAIYIDSDRIDKYIVARRKDGVTNSTVNRELAVLRRMYRLAMRRTPPKVMSCPHIPHLEEAPPRSGFLEYEDYQKLLVELPEYLKLALTIAYHTGQRSGEVFSLTWSTVNMTEGSITLKPINTKTKEPRIVFLSGEFYQAIYEQKVRRDAEYPDCPFVVFNKGKQIKDSGTAWNSACKRASVTGLLFHDLRRSGCRNMIQAGVDEKTARTISGHKTSEVFKRYQIINEANLRDASQKVVLHLSKKKEKV
jgi:integrase